MKKIISVLLILGVMFPIVAQNLVKRDIIFYHKNNSLTETVVKQYVAYTYIMSNEVTNEAIAVNIARKYSANYVDNNIYNNPEVKANNISVVYGANSFSNIKANKINKYDCTAKIKSYDIKKAVEEYNQLYGEVSFYIILDTANSNVNFNNTNKNDNKNLLYTKLVNHTTDLLTAKGFTVKNNISKQTNNNSFFDFNKYQENAVNIGANYVIHIEISSLTINNNKTNIDEVGNAYKIENAIFSYKIYSLLSNSAIASKQIIIKEVTGKDFAELINNLSETLMLQLSNNSVVYGNQGSGLFSTFYNALNKEFVNGYNYTFFIASKNATQETVASILTKLEREYSFTITNQPIKNDNIINFTISKSKFLRSDFISSFIAEAKNKKMSLEIEKQNSQFVYLNDTEQEIIDPDDEPDDNSSAYSFISRNEIELDIKYEYPDWEFPDKVTEMKFEISDGTDIVFNYYTVKKFKDKIRIKLKSDFKFIKGRTYTFYFDEGDKVIECKYKK